VEHPLAQIRGKGTGHGAGPFDGPTRPRKL
jgi:hypothetical protein